MKQACKYRPSGPTKTGPGTSNGERESQEVAYKPRPEKKSSTGGKRGRPAKKRKRDSIETGNHSPRVANLRTA